VQRELHQVLQLSNHAGLLNKTALHTGHARHGALVSADHRHVFATTHRCAEQHQENLLQKEVARLRDLVLQAGHAERGVLATQTDCKQELVLTQTDAERLWASRQFHRRADQQLQIMKLLSQIAIGIAEHGALARAEGRQEHA